MAVVENILVCARGNHADVGGGFGYAGGRGVTNVKFKDASNKELRVVREAPRDIDRNMWHKADVVKCIYGREGRVHRNYMSNYGCEH